MGIFETAERKLSKISRWATSPTGGPQISAPHEPYAFVQVLLRLTTTDRHIPAPDCHLYSYITRGKWLAATFVTMQSRPSGGPNPLHISSSSAASGTRTDSYEVRIDLRKQLA